MPFPDTEGVTGSSKSTLRPTDPRAASAEPVAAGRLSHVSPLSVHEPVVG